MTDVLTFRTLTAAVLLLSLAGCYSVSYGPAGYERHGVWLPGTSDSDYRPKKTIVVGDLEMRFDEELRVYRIVGMPDHYYSAGSYYRLSEGRWETARGIDGPWVAIPDDQLIPTLSRLGATN